MQYLKGGGLVHQQMRYFIAVVDQNSFFEAAETCHISQSAISQQIKALERELGVELLERHGRRFVVTPAGRYFYNQARRQVDALDVIVCETRRIGSGEHQRLRVGVLNGFSGRVMQAAVGDFAAAHPNVTLTLATGTHEAIFQRMLAGEVDMVINDQRRALSDQYVNAYLTEQAMGALVRREYAQARVSCIELSDLRDLLLICVTGEAWRDAEVSWWRDTVGVQSDILFAENMDAALMNVSAGIGFLPCDGDMPAAAGNHWLSILRNGLPFTRKMFAFWPDGKEATLHWEFARAVRRAIK